MDKKIDDILKDLYSIDPGLKNREHDLRTLVQDLLVSKPFTRFDESFAQQLKADLIGSTYNEPVASPFSYASPYAYRLRYSVIGGILALLIVAPLTYFATQKTIQYDPTIAVKNLSTGLSLKQQISSKGYRAFGTIAYSAPKSAAAPKESDAASGTAPATLSAPIASSSTAGSASTSTVEVSTINALPFSNAANTALTYSGGEFTIDGTEAKLFKRTTGTESRNQLAEIIRESNFGFTNLNSFSSLSLKDLELAENSQEGYSIKVNFDAGTISIKALQPTTTKDLLSSKIKVPTDMDIINISEGFIKGHGIDMSAYGAPIVGEKTYSISSKHAGKSTEYVHGVVHVTYPLLVEGTKVFDTNGKLFGLDIAVDPAQSRVVSATNLTSQVYDSSVYPIENDPQKVIDAAIRAGGNGDKTTASLDTPERILVRHVKGSDELYIPAMLFGVKSTGQNIIVPLVKNPTVAGGLEQKDAQLVPEVGTSSATSSKNK